MSDEPTERDVETTCNAYYTDGPHSSDACGLPADHWPNPHSWETRRRADDEFRWSPSERDVEDMLALRFPKWKQWERDEFALRIEGIIAERIAEARREGATDTASLLRRARDRIRHDHAYPMEVGPHHCDGCDLRDEIDATLRGETPPPDHAPTGGPVNPFGPFPHDGGDGT